MTPETLKEGQIGYCVNWAIEQMGDKFYIEKDYELHNSSGGTVQVAIKKRNVELVAFNCTEPTPEYIPNEIQAMISFHFGSPPSTAEEKRQKFLAEHMEVKLI